MRTKAAIKAAAVLAVLAATTTKADYDTDLYNLSHLIYGEAAGCSYDMMLSVGSVVLNRVADDRFPDTLAEVIWQEGQYSCTWDGNFYQCRYFMMWRRYVSMEISNIQKAGQTTGRRSSRSGTETHCSGTCWRILMIRPAWILRADCRTCGIWPAT